MARAARAAWSMVPVRIGVMAASHAYPWAARPASQPGWPSAAARAVCAACAATQPASTPAGAGQVTELV